LSHPFVVSYWCSFYWSFSRNLR